jgi:AcrR family transcriptional regulator
MSLGKAAANILRVAEDALLHADPGSLRIDRIARSAGVNKRMIYHYFGDRAGLIRAVYGRQIQRLSHPQAALSDAARGVLQMMLGNPNVAVQQTARDEADWVPDGNELGRAARLLLP